MNEDKKIIMLGNITADEERDHQSGEVVSGGA